MTEIQEKAFSELVRIAPRTLELIRPPIMGMVDEAESYMRQRDRLLEACEGYFQARCGGGIHSSAQAALQNLSNVVRDIKAGK